MIERYLIILFVFISFSNYGQNSGGKIDGLKNELVLGLADTSKVSVYIKLGDLYMKKSPDSSLNFFTNAHKLAVNLNSKSQIANSLNKIGQYYEYKNQFEDAIKYYLKSLVLYKELKDEGKMATVYYETGLCYDQLYAEGKALEYYMKSLALNKKMNNKFGIAGDYLGIGNLFYMGENYQLAEEYMLDALEICKKLNDPEGISACYINLGNIRAGQGDIQGSLEFYFKSLKIMEEVEDKKDLSIDYNNIGDSYLDLKDYEKSKLYFYKALEIAIENDDKSMMALIYLNLAAANNKEKKYRETIINSEKSIKLSKELNDLLILPQNLLLLATAHGKLGNRTEEIVALKEHIKFKDSLINKDKAKKVQLLRAMWELSETQFTIDELSIKSEMAELKYKNGRKLTYFLIIAVLLFSILIIVLNRQRIAKKKAYNLLESKNQKINSMNNEIQMQRDDLRKLNITKDRFFSIIAHDLKNPFNSIQGFTELMIENSSNYDEEKRLKFLRIIKESTRSASNLLENLLLWASNQSGNLNFIPGKIRLIDRVSDVISLVEIQAINKEIKIVGKVKKEHLVRADPNILDTILRNLLSNAVKFTQVKGNVEISSRKKRTGLIEVKVKDNGIGISSEDIDNIFSIDVKNSNVGTSNEQGSGLGLIICKDFVEMHGGTIWVNSKLNEGSEFIFTLPAW